VPVGSCLVRLWGPSADDGPGIGVVPFSPLGRGMLTGAITSREDLPENGCNWSYGVTPPLSR
jgi:hypothetical protein